jgi:hypothetical protein
VAASRLNVTKRKGLSPEGREQIREAILFHQPWRFTTGPRTPEGKARSAANGKVRQKGAKSVREVRAELAEVRGLIKGMAATRKQAAELASGEREGG